MDPGDTLARIHMLGLLFGLALILGAADHWTTWLCLTGGFGDTTIVEANPLAAWLFETLGVRAGLTIDSVVTATVLLFLVRTRRLPRRAKLALLATLVAISGHALASNLRVLQTLGATPVVSA
jgi:hypothetical protein